MAYEYQGEGALDYFPCRYGTSKLLFRGPRRKLEGDYVAVIGGTETYGKFVEQPFPAIVEEGLGMPVVNFGYVNAGLDVFLQEPVVLDACAGSRVTVIQLIGAQNMSNRFYAVHPRRNDRFLRASTLMKTVFREVDFTEFHFTRHMLSQMKAQFPDKFAILENELKTAWVARMKTMLQKFEGPTVLLWLGDHHPPGRAPDSLGLDPLMVDEEMVAEIRPFATQLVRVNPTHGARIQGTAGMRFAPLDEPAAAEMPGPAVHSEIADALLPIVRELA